ncbi:hypothetical protein P3T23_008245 [Paraburkholderia sp. GAS448]
MKNCLSGLLLWPLCLRNLSPKARRVKGRVWVDLDRSVWGSTNWSGTVEG